MAEQKPIGVISIGSNDIHLLVATSDGIGAFDRQANQSVLAELVGAVKGGVVPAKALGQALQDLEMLVKVARSAGASPTSRLLQRRCARLRMVPRSSTWLASRWISRQR